MSVRQPQNELTLELLRLRGRVGVSARELFVDYGIYRAGARVFDLRRRGHRIETLRRRGETAVYRLMA